MSTAPTTVPAGDGTVPTTTVVTPGGTAGERTSEASGAVTPRRRRPRPLRTRLARVRRTPDSGMTTAEYAVGTVAACAFGGLLYKVVTSGEVMSLVTDVIRRGLSLSM